MAASCKEAVGWMFARLDTSGDLFLEAAELATINLDKYEVCIRAFFNSCDTSKDGRVSAPEWCFCFWRESALRGHAWGVGAMGRGVAHRGLGGLGGLDAAGIGGGREPWLGGMHTMGWGAVSVTGEEGMDPMGFGGRGLHPVEVGVCTLWGPGEAHTVGWGGICCSSWGVGCTMCSGGLYPMVWGGNVHPGVRGCLLMGGAACPKSSMLCVGGAAAEPPCLRELEKIQIQEAAKKKPGESGGSRHRCAPAAGSGRDEDGELQGVLPLHVFLGVLGGGCVSSLPRRHLHPQLR